VLNLGNVKITGGTLDGVTIGATVPSSGWFTDLYTEVANIQEALVKDISVESLREDRLVFVGPGGRLVTPDVDLRYEEGVLNLGNVKITGGTLDGVLIGGNVPSSGWFADLYTEVANIQEAFVNDISVESLREDRLVFVGPGGKLVTPDVDLRYEDGVLNLGNVKITGGTLDGVIIGATVPSSGWFTDLYTEVANIQEALVKDISVESLREDRLVFVGKNGTLSTADTDLQYEKGVLTIATARILGGDLDNVQIGLNTPGAGVFSKVSAAALYLTELPEGYVLKVGPEGLVGTTPLLHDGVGLHVQGPIFFGGVISYSCEELLLDHYRLWSLSVAVEISRLSCPEVAPACYTCVLPPGVYDGQRKVITAVCVASRSMIRVTGPIRCPGNDATALLFMTSWQSVTLEWVSAVSAWVSNSTGTVDLFDARFPPSSLESIEEYTPSAEKHCCAGKVLDIVLLGGTPLLLNLTYTDFRFIVQSNRSTPGEFRCHLPEGASDGQKVTLTVADLLPDSTIVVEGDISTAGHRKADLVFSLRGQSVQLQWLAGTRSWFSTNTGCLDVPPGQQAGVLRDEPCAVGAPSHHREVDDMVLVESGENALIRPDVHTTRVRSTAFFPAVLTLSDGQFDGQGKVLLLVAGAPCAVQVTGSFLNDGRRSHSIALLPGCCVTLLWDGGDLAWQTMTPAITRLESEHVNCGISGGDNDRERGTPQSQELVLDACKPRFEPSHLRLHAGQACALPPDHQHVWLDASDAELRCLVAECVLPDGTADGETKVLVLVAVAEGAAVAVAGRMCRQVLLSTEGDTLTLMWNARQGTWFHQQRAHHDTEGLRPAETPPIDVTPVPVSTTIQEDSRELRKDPVVHTCVFDACDDASQILPHSAASTRICVSSEFTGVAHCTVPDGEKDGQRHFVLVVSLPHRAAVRLHGAIRQNGRPGDLLTFDGEGQGVMLEWIAAWGAWCAIGWSL